MLLWFVLDTEFSITADLYWNIARNLLFLLPLALGLILTRRTLTCSKIDGISITSL